MNNPVWLVLAVVGVALALGVVFFFLGSGPPGPAPESLIPDSIEDFILVTKEARIDPVFPGEEYSSHAFYTPAPGSPWSGKVERLGVTVFKFKDPTKITEAQGLLLRGAKTEPLTLGNRTVEFSLEEDGAGLFWKDRMLFIAIFVTVPTNSQIDPAMLKKAALAAGQAVLTKAAR